MAAGSSMSKKGLAFLLLALGCDAREQIDTVARCTADDQMNGLCPPDAAVIVPRTHEEIDPSAFSIIGGRWQAPYPGVVGDQINAAGQDVYCRTATQIMLCINAIDPMAGPFERCAWATCSADQTIHLSATAYRILYSGGSSVYITLESTPASPYGYVFGWATLDIVAP